jgi:hypothetical protein
MDEIDKLIRELRNDGRVRKTRFSNRFVNTIGEVYEKYGYGATRALLLDKLDDRRARFEAQTLLEVLDKVDEKNLPSSIGGFIIRKITTLRG